MKGFIYPMVESKSLHGARPIYFNMLVKIYFSCAN